MLKETGRECVCFGCVDTYSQAENELMSVRASGVSAKD